MRDYRKVPVWWAAAVGLVWVNFPVLPLMLAPMFIWIWVVVRFDLDSGPRSVAILFVTLAVGFVLAWTWWSWNVPKWRVWAFRRVDDIEKLKAVAVHLGIIWPDGHKFEKTEFRSQKENEIIDDLQDGKSKD